MAENVLSGECENVDASELADLVTAGWALLDVRTAEEHAHGAIDGSTNIPIDELREHLDQITRPTVVYCEVGQRGHTATTLLRELGIDARNLDGGYRTWRASTAPPSRRRDGPVAQRRFFGRFLPDRGCGPERTTTFRSWAGGTTRATPAGRPPARRRDGHRTR